MLFFLTFSTRKHLKNFSKHILLILLLIAIINGCSTNKNTWTSRNFQALNTRFNVYFNGTVSYDEGLKNIQKANKEDYSGVIPMYPISRHANANAATTNMDITIEKCRKAIKLHSIKVKPEKDYKRANSPEYMLFYNQEEFNPALKDAWLLLGKAEFHKANFLGSVSTFSYIIRHYGSDKNLEAICQLWIVRAYGEMGWIYEAEQMLSKVDQNSLKYTNTGLYASVNADLFLKRHLYNEAIPFLQLALSKETDTNLKLRFSYLLAQLYQKTNDKKAAYDAYSKVIKSSPPYEMDFNARISRAQLGQGNISDIRKELLNMLKNRNNKDYLDQLHFALGNTYLQHADTLKAIENYKLSIDKSTRNGIEKAVTLITLGDIYYKKRNYVLAQPYYENAAKIINKDYNDYDRVTQRAETLSELVAQNDIVVLQDSLQKLSAMPESKRVEVVNNVITKLIADEKAAADKELKDKQNAIANSEDNIATMLPIGVTPGVAGDWYFYNIDVMRTGESEFIKKWGKRKLEDNWRRTNKVTSLFSEDNVAQTVVGDSTDTISKAKVINDNRKPEFYLRQIPVTPDQMANSNANIATALFTMGQIYKDKIEDIPMSINTFEKFIDRFKSDRRVPNAYFNIYLMQSKIGNKTEVELYRSKIINEYPNTKYQKILSEPNYNERLERMNQEQDSIYDLTYKAYNESDFKTVFKQVNFIKQNYPLSTLMPKFLFLNALSIGKNDTAENFRIALTELVKNYPESDVNAMAKDMLALLKQGQQVKAGTTSGSLLELRDEKTKTEINEISTQQFSTEKQTNHRLLLISTINKDSMNRLLYNIATFNFSRFMIKDFDLTINKFDNTKNSLSVTSFVSYDEAVWYLNSISSDVSLNKLMTDFHVQKVIISEENYALLRSSYSLVDYLAFLAKKSENKPQEQVALDKTAEIQVNKVIVEGNKTNIAVNKIKKQEITTDKSGIKTIDKITDNSPQPNNTSKQDTSLKIENTTPSSPQLEVSVKPTPIVQPKQEKGPLFKGLFAYRANEPHFIAIYIVSGSFDFAKTKTAIDAYNAKNYSIMNLKVSLEAVGKQQVIIIGSLNDAEVAKSYLLRLVKEKSLFEGLKGANYRNLLGSHENLNTMIQQNALTTYFEFMKEFYLK